MIPNVRGSTALYLIPGDPVTHVRLPRMFNAAFERFGVDAMMAPVQVHKRDLAVFVKAAFLASNVHGMVIAPPHKPLLLDLLDGSGLFARAAGSVNVVRRIEGGALEGDLFDGEGLIGALDRFHIPFRGKRVLVLGAGVSAAAIGVALAEGGTVDGAETIAFFDASAGKAAGVAAKLDDFFDAHVIAVDSADPAGFDLIVNATPSGLQAADVLPVEVGRIEPHAAVFDILLRGQPTPLVQAARERGLHAQAGFEMLVQQMPHYFDFFGLHDVAEGLRQDSDFLRELIFPAAMAEEIASPLIYRSDSVA